jgi:hypothetical protein
MVSTATEPLPRSAGRSSLGHTRVVPRLHSADRHRDKAADGHEHATLSVDMRSALVLIAPAGTAVAIAYYFAVSLPAYNRDRSPLNGRSTQTSNGSTNDVIENRDNRKMADTDACFQQFGTESERRRLTSRTPEAG